MKISEITNDKQIISARINKYIYEEFKRNEIPISTVVEAGLINFLKLSEDKKILFLSENIPECSDKEDIIPMKLKWNEFLVDSLKRVNIPLAIGISIVAGPLIGPICIIAGALFSNNSKKSCDTEDDLL